MEISNRLGCKQTDSSVGAVHWHPSQDVQTLLVKQEMMNLTRMSDVIFVRILTRHLTFFEMYVNFCLETEHVDVAKNSRTDIGGLMFLALDLDRIDLESASWGGGTVAGGPFFAGPKSNVLPLPVRHHPKRPV